MSEFKQRPTISNSEMVEILSSQLDFRAQVAVGRFENGSSRLVSTTVRSEDIANSPPRHINDLHIIHLIYYTVLTKNNAQTTKRMKIKIAKLATDSLVWRMLLQYDPSLVDSVW